MIWTNSCMDLNSEMGPALWTDSRSAPSSVDGPLDETHLEKPQVGRTQLLAPVERSCPRSPGQPEWSLPFRPGFALELEVQS